MNLKGKKILLRAIEKEDIEFLRTMINDETMERQVGGWSFPISKYEQDKWFESQINNTDSIRCIIELEGSPIGLETLTDIDWKNRKACHGIKLYNEKIRGKGYGTDTLKTIMKYAFEELQLNKLYTTILEHNEVSIKLHKKCGWEIEGTLKESVFKNNRYIDEVQIAILKKQYEEIKEQWK